MQAELWRSDRHRWPGVDSVDGKMVASSSIPAGGDLLCALDRSALPCPDTPRLLLMGLSPQSPYCTPHRTYISHRLCDV